MCSADKIVSRERAAEVVAGLRGQGQRVVFANGCFDLLHGGHVRFLEQAGALGDLLIVGVNRDESVRALKGAGRPILPEEERAQLVAALASVDLVIVFPEMRVTPLLRLLRPEVFAKGRDYTLENMDQGERRCVEAYGGEIAFIPTPWFTSSSDVIERIAALRADEGARQE